MSAQDEKKPPMGGGAVIAQIGIDLMEGGGARLSAVCGGAPDCGYAAMPDGRLPGEVTMLVGELRARWISQGRPPDTPR